MVDMRRKYKDLDILVVKYEDCIQVFWVKSRKYMRVFELQSHKIATSLGKVLVSTSSPKWDGTSVMGGGGKLPPLALAIYCNKSIHLD